jgi:hypothetical protein
VFDLSMNHLKILANGCGDDKTEDVAVNGVRVVSRGGASTWSSSASHCRPCRGGEVEDDELPLGGSRLSAKYRIGI